MDVPHTTRTLVEKVQIDPQARSSVVVTTGQGEDLALDVGRTVVARAVESARPGETAQISLAGQNVRVRAEVPINAGDRLELTVRSSDSRGVTFTLNQQPDARSVATSQAAIGTNARSAATSQSATGTSIQSTSIQSASSSPTTTPSQPNQTRVSELVPAGVKELARSGVNVTPQLTDAVSKLVEQLVTSSSGTPSSPPTGVNASATFGGQPSTTQPTTTDSAARAAANLAARGLPLSPEGANRVAAALDLAGRVGTALNQLAQVSPQISRALPNTPPDLATLRSSLAPALTNAELATARIVHAGGLEPGQGASTGAPSSNPAAVSKYIAQQLNIDIADANPNDAQLRPTTTTRLDQARLDALLRPASNADSQPPSHSSQASTSQSPISSAPAQANSSQTTQQQASGSTPPGSLSAANATNTSSTASTQTSKPVPVEMPVGSTSKPVSGNAPNSVDQNTRPQPANAGSAISSASPGATATPTNAALASSVANLANLVSRWATALAPTEGALGHVAHAQAREMSAVQGQAPAGTFTPEAAGGSSSGGPAPLVAMIREGLANSTDPNAWSRMADDLARQDPGAVNSALARLGESETLKLAGRLLGALPRSATDSADMSALQGALHNVLDDIGASLRSQSSDDVLRTALEQAARTDPRPAVAETALRLLHAMDGTQILSQPRLGDDPGYAFFQLPMPGGAHAEVLVRREPGRRQISFDQFDIAFLLETKNLGNLMIRLDAHPAGVRADIKTDLPAVEPFISSFAEKLSDPVAREAKRPVTVTVGVFGEEGAPASLLTPDTALNPGEGVWYA